MELNFFGFVLILAAIAVQHDAVAYQSTGPSKCCACGHAMYKMVFQGTWSRHTHPKDFPTDEGRLALMHWSNVVGATHNDEYSIWRYGEYASSPVKQVCEFGFSNLLERNMKLNTDKIRTVVKTSSMWRDVAQAREAMFTVNRDQHFLSLITMVGPSPDWCAGVSHLDICTKDCKWVDNIELDLYPWDAGTDSGLTYFAANKPTFPREAIHNITHTFPDNPAATFYSKEPIKPLARLILRKTSDVCTEEDRSQIEQENSAIPDADKCATTDWTRWGVCSNRCGPGVRVRRRILKNKSMRRSMCDMEFSQRENCVGDCTKKRRRQKHLSDNFVVRHQTETVKSDPCAVTPWSEWGPCSVSCGRGLRESWRMFFKKGPENAENKCGVKLMKRDFCRAEIVDCRKATSMFNYTAICSLPMMQGPCKGNFKRYYFNPEKQSCESFVYGGCRGNGNMFLSARICKSVCIDDQRMAEIKNEIGFEELSDFLSYRDVRRMKKKILNNEVTDGDMEMMRKKFMIMKQKQESARIDMSDAKILMLMHQWGLTDRQKMEVKRKLMEGMTEKELMMLKDRFIEENKKVEQDKEQSEEYPWPIPHAKLVMLMNVWGLTDAQKKIINQHVLDGIDKQKFEMVRQQMMAENLDKFPWPIPDDKLNMLMVQWGLSDKQQINMKQHLMDGISREKFIMIRQQMMDDNKPKDEFPWPIPDDKLMMLMTQWGLNDKQQMVLKQNFMDGISLNKFRMIRQQMMDENGSRDEFPWPIPDDKLMMLMVQWGLNDKQQMLLKQHLMDGISRDKFIMIRQQMMDENKSGDEFPWPIPDNKLMMLMVQWGLTDKQQMLLKRHLMDGISRDKFVMIRQQMLDENKSGDEFPWPIPDDKLMMLMTQWGLNDKQQMVVKQHLMGGISRDKFIMIRQQMMDENKSGDEFPWPIPDDKLMMLMAQWGLNSDQQIIIKQSLMNGITRDKFKMLLGELTKAIETDAVTPTTSDSPDKLWPIPLEKMPMLMHQWGLSEDQQSVMKQYLMDGITQEKFDTLLSQMKNENTEIVTNPGSDISSNQHVSDIPWPIPLEKFEMLKAQWKINDKQMAELKDKIMGKISKQKFLVRLRSMQKDNQDADSGEKLRDKMLKEIQFWGLTEKQQGIFKRRLMNGMSDEDLVILKDRMMKKNTERKHANKNKKKNGKKPHGTGHGSNSKKDKKFYHKVSKALNKLSIKELIKFKSDMSKSHQTLLGLSIRKNDKEVREMIKSELKMRREKHRKVMEENKKKKKDNSKHQKVNKSQYSNSDTTRDCKLSAWSEWTACTATCGVTHKTRTRGVLASAQNGGKECPKDLTKQKQCYVPKCPVDCVMGEWGEWSSCSRSCGQNAIQQRRRQIKVKPKRKGKPCLPKREKKFCNLPMCPK